MFTNRRQFLTTATIGAMSLTTQQPLFSADQPKKLLLIAGKPSHPPRMHEFRAGCYILEKCLKDVKGLTVEVHENGWVKNDSALNDADAVVIYSDGGGGHPILQANHLDLLRSRIRKGMGFGCMHFAVEVPPTQGSTEMKDWIGGHYEHMYSVNPMWKPEYTTFPEHPITRGVKPFAVVDEWYFNMRFQPGFSADKAYNDGDLKFTPILVATPTDTVRNGPYVYPRGPYAHIQAASGRKEAMMWALERPDGGRGFGFTGGHNHDNWADNNYRKVVLNALLWLSKCDIPAEGLESQLNKADLEAKLDPKGKR